MNFLVFFLFYFFITFSVVGYGFLFQHFVLPKNNKVNLGYIGIFGLSFCYIYSGITSFFISHSLIHNFIFLIIGFFIFFYKFKLNFRFEKENYYFLILIFLILFVSSLVFKNHDDFEYYHFSYTHFLTQSSAVLGMGLFNHGFRTPSSLFYINSLFYLPLIKFYFFHITAILVMGFANIILLQQIKSACKLKSYDFATLMAVMIFIFINIFFYRIAEHGTDRSAQILVLIMILDLLIVINYQKYLKNNFDKVAYIIILISIIISFKAFYILYSVFVVYLSYILVKEKKLINFIFKYNKVIIFSFLSFLLIFFINFSNSGCFLYPIRFSCFEIFPWTINLEEVDHMKNWYEQWSKGGAGPNFRVENPELYIKKFNWVSNWIQVYFIGKVTDTLLGVITLIFIMIYFFIDFSKKIRVKRTYKIIMLLVVILFMEWFYQHPALRYGGFCLIALLFFLPTSIYIEKFFNKKNIEFKFTSLVCIVFLIFLGRNIHRISKESDKYSYMPIMHTYYNVNQENVFIIENKIKNSIQKFNICLSKNLNNKCNNQEDHVIGLYKSMYFFAAKK